MKLLYVTNARFPTEKAHGIQIAKMCESFAMCEEISELKLILPWRFNHIKDDPFKYYQVNNNFRIIKLPSLDLIRLELPKIVFWIQSLTFLLAAVIYVYFQDADIIYTRDLSLAWAISLFRENVFCELHSLPSWAGERKFRKIKGIIVITKMLKDALIGKGVDEEKIIIAPDGVSLKKFIVEESQEEIRREMNLPVDKKIVLYAGHLYKWKGVFTLLEATKFLSTDVLVVFVGGTKKDIRKFKTKKKEYALNNILIIGHRNFREIPKWLAASDVLVLPNSAKENISKYWTSPMKMFEYMASKKPIVASDLLSLREVLDKNNAILVLPDNPQELSKGIEKALKDQDFSNRIARRAFEDVQRYDWARRSRRIVDFLIENKKEL